MKKLKKITLKIEKEIISELNGNHLNEIRGGDLTKPLPTNLSDKCKGSDQSDCCSFNTNCICITENYGNCTNSVLCNTNSGGNLCGPITNPPVLDTNSSNCTPIAPGTLNRCIVTPVPVESGMLCGR